MHGACDPKLNLMLKNNSKGESLLVKRGTKKKVKVRAGKNLTFTYQMGLNFAPKK